MSWLVKRVAGIRKTGMNIGTSGKSVATGLTLEKASALKKELNETDPDNIFVIAPEVER